MRHFLNRLTIKHLLFFGVLFAVIAPSLFTIPALFSFLDFSKTGQIGDTIGGIAGPILNFVGLILVYISFRQQLRANEIQIKALRDEHDRNSQTKSFEILNGLVGQFKDELEKIPKIKESYFNYSKGKLRDDSSLPSINLMNLLLFGEQILEKIGKADLDIEDKNSLLSIFYFYFYYKMNPIFFDFENKLHIRHRMGQDKEHYLPIDNVLFRIKSRLDEIYSINEEEKNIFDLTEKFDQKTSRQHDPKKTGIRL